MEEKDIIQKLIAGDPGIHRIFFRKYKPYLYAVAMKIVKNRMDADDVVQISFMKIFRYLPSWKGENPVKHWMAMIVRNTAITYLVQNKKHTSCCELAEWEPMQKRAPNFFDAITAGDIYRHAMKELHELSGNQYMYARLFLEEQMDYKEISEDIDVPIGTVKSQVSRACASLRKIISELEKESDYKAA